MAITTRHTLLTDSWTADVDTLETAVRKFHAGGRPANDCHVAFFEIAGDANLHVNVVHTRATTTKLGWSGPGDVPGGFVHNRMFGDEPMPQMIRHIREMVFATEIAHQTRLQ